MAPAKASTLGDARQGVEDGRRELESGDAGNRLNSLTDGLDTRTGATIGSNLPDHRP
jgi:hypothetical protein